MAYNFYRNNDNKVSVICEEYSKIKDQFHLYDLLCECWNKDTCAPRLRDKWNKDNITCGQCSITSFLVQDLFGGEVYGIKTSSGIHCFNKIGDNIYDLTSEQFGRSIELKYTLDNIQNRKEHFEKEEKYQRYLLLKNLLKNKMEN